MLTIVSGALGSGKSLFSTIYSYLGYKNKRKVVCNYKLNFKYTEFKISSFLKGNYNDCIIILDEVYQYIDSRNSMTEMNRLFSYILFQSRKKHIEIFIIAQMRETIDLRFRSLTDFIIECNQIREGFIYTLFRPNLPMERCISFLPIEKAMNYFKLYNTDEIVAETNHTKYLTDKEKVEFLEEKASFFISEYITEFNKKNPKSKKIKKPTKSHINVWSLKNEVDKSLRTLLYNTVITKMS